MSKILLITPNFFDYPQKICEKLEEMGHEVDWYDDRPSTNAFIKAIIRINKNYINFYIEKYFKKVLSEIKNIKYDKFILISGQSLSFSKKMLEDIKKCQNNAEFILYQWDSLKNFEYIKEFKEIFDRSYTFDIEDFNNNDYLKFLPLFYTDSYKMIGDNKVDDYQYDFMFVGTAHPKKYHYIKEMSEKLLNKFKNQYIYFFFPSKIVYIYRKLLNKEFKNAKMSDFNYKAISNKELMELIKKSRCILDSAQSNQVGLTIRVIEALGAKRKIITTNKDVVNYDFYRPENIYVYDDEFDFKHPFFNEGYKDVDENVYKKYSIKNWLNVLLTQEESNENFSYRC